MHIPCPAYKLTDIVKAHQSDVIPAFEQVEERNLEPEPIKYTKALDEVSEMKKHPEPPESLIQEQKVHTV